MLPLTFHVLYYNTKRAALQKRTRLRAYNDASKSYETISQVKNIATNVINKCEILPNVLNVSCGCQGLSERMKYWWDNEIGFLPDILEGNFCFGIL